MDQLQLHVTRPPDYLEEPERAPAPVPVPVPQPLYDPLTPAAPRFDLRRSAAGFFHLRGVEPDGLAAVSVMFGAGAGLIFFADHCGMGAVLGLFALVLSDLARVPAATLPAACDRRARLLVPLAEPMMLAGLLAGIAVRHAPLVVVLACIVAVLHAWLPRLRSLVRERGLDAPMPLWGRTARLGMVLFGALSGRLGLALFVVACVGLLTAWRHVEQLESWPAIGRVESWMRSRRLLDEHGAWTPALRWSSLALIALGLLLLPVSSSWRF